MLKQQKGGKDGALKRKKARRQMPPGGIPFWKKRADNALGAELECSRRPPVIAMVGASFAVLTYHRFSPIERAGPAPGLLRLIKPIAGLDEVIGRGKVVRGVRDDPTPTVPPGAQLHRPHQPELQRTSTMPINHAELDRNIPRSPRASREPIRQKQPAGADERQATSVPNRTPESARCPRM